MSAFLSPVEILSSNVSALAFEVPFEIDSLSPHIHISVTTNLGEVQTGHEMRSCSCVMSVAAEWRVEPEGPVQAKANCCIGITVGIKDAVAAGAPDGIDFNQVLRLNAVSLAYGKIRCAIEVASAETTAGKLSIPTIDPTAYLDAVNGQAEEVPE